MDRYVSNSPEETIAAGMKIAKKLKGGDCILYLGEMGAGKTHLTKGIAKYFNSPDEAVSPTFALVNEYGGDIPIYHFDLFRISTLDDLYAIGFFDYFDMGGIMCIEWSENIPELNEIIKNHSIVKITKTGDNSRIIEFTPSEELC